jgi:predicted HicB family RNase H-like nuclease
MNTMHYEGYTAKIEFDERDNIFWGKVMGLKDRITFEGNTVEELRADFEAAIQHYLADCKQNGIEPHKSYSGNLMLRVGSETHAAAAIAAESTGKSLNQWASEVINRAVQV